MKVFILIMYLYSGQMNQVATAGGPIQIGYFKSEKECHAAWLSTSQQFGRSGAAKVENRYACVEVWNELVQ